MHLSSISYLLQVSENIDKINANLKTPMLQLAKDRSEVLAKVPTESNDYDRLDKLIKDVYEGHDNLVRLNDDISADCSLHYKKPYWYQDQPIETDHLQSFKRFLSTMKEEYEEIRQKFTIHISQANRLRVELEALIDQADKYWSTIIQSDDSQETRGMVTNLENILTTIRSKQSDLKNELEVVISVKEKYNSRQKIWINLLMENPPKSFVYSSTPLFSSSRRILKFYGIPQSGPEITPPTPPTLSRPRITPPSLPTVQQNTPSTNLIESLLNSRGKLTLENVVQRFYTKTNENHVDIKSTDLDCVLKICDNIDEIKDNLTTPMRQLTVERTKVLAKVSKSMVLSESGSSAYDRLDKLIKDINVEHDNLVQLNDKISTEDSLHFKEPYWYQDQPIDVKHLQKIKKSLNNMKLDYDELHQQFIKFIGQANTLRSEMEREIKTPTNVVKELFKQAILRR